MKLRILIVCLLVSSSLYLLFASYKIFACGPSDDNWYVWGYFIPEQNTNIVEQPLFVSWDLYYNYSFPDTLQKAENNLNIAEWMQFTGNVLSKQDVSLLLYDYATEFQTLRNSLQKANPAGLNQAYAHLYEQIRKLPNYNAIIEYVSHARSLERICIRDVWDDNPISYEEVQTKIMETKRMIAKSKTSFFTQRLCFHLQRLYFQNKQYDEAISYYEKQIKPQNIIGSIKYRTLSYYAGSLYHKQRFGASNYYFSLIYDQYLGGKMRAYESFHPWDDSDWDSTLSMTKNAREKEVLWQMFGIYADPVLAMREIYKINPQSNFLDLLLVRAVNIEEMYSEPNFSGVSRKTEAKNTWNETLPAATLSSAQSFSSLQTQNQSASFLRFVDSCARNQNTLNKGLWHSAAAYLCLLAHNTTACKYHLQQIANDNTASAQVKLQGNITAALLFTCNLNHIDKQAEKEIFTHLSAIRSSGDKEQHAFKTIQTQLSKLYEKQNDEIKALLCGSDTLKKTFYRSPEKTESLLSFMRKKDLSDCERLYLSSFELKERDIVDGQAVDYLYNQNFAQAIAKFEELPDTGNFTLPGNPFNIHIVDCHDCDHAAKQRVTYTRYTFTKKLQEMLLKAQTSNDSTEKAQNYFLIGNGLYNMTYYGNGRAIHEQSLLSCKYEWNEDFSAYSGDKRFYDCTPALEYYKKALEYAPKNEFKAKCAWMCAKCEHAMNYTNGKIPQYGNKIDFIAGSYFNLLQQSYRNTKYYNEIIAECGYFCTFNGGGKDCIKTKDEY